VAEGNVTGVSSRNVVNVVTLRASFFQRSTNAGSLTISMLL